MERYTVTGMSCAACSARVEKAVCAVPGVTACAVSLLTASMTVEGDAPAATVIAAVEAAGYGASLQGNSAGLSDGSEEERRALRQMKGRFFSSLVFAVLLMYLSMGHVMWGFPLPGLLCGHPRRIAVIQMLLAAAVLIINRKFFINGVRGLWHRAPNMDTLVALGSAASFGYSLAVLGSMWQAAAPAELLHGLYFESAAMIPVLITLGKMLEERSRGKTGDALRGLLRLAPRTATLLREGQPVQVPADAVRQGDIFLLYPGDAVPADGRILEGHSAMDESALTGESLPVEKACGDAVSAACVNLTGFLKCEALRVGEETSLAQIVRMVRDASATKAPIAKLADRVAGIFVPTVLGIALAVFVLWMLLGASVGTALEYAVAVLVISCPCALGLATPVAVMVGNGVGARGGILFKTAAALEIAGRVETVALDKTGTVTCGRPEVTDILCHEISEERLLCLAASLELQSEHPLGRAVCRRAEGIRPEPVSDVQAHPGGGISGTHDGEVLRGGNAEFIQKAAEIPPELQRMAEKLADAGKTVMFFARGSQLLGAIAAADAPKADSAAAVDALRRMGLRTVMLTGDNDRTARAVAASVGIAEYVAALKPDGKEAAIRRLSREGRVAMVGDGINDAPALTRADLGIAIGGGTDIAADAADVVLVSGRLSDLCAAIRLGRATLRNIRQNLFWAFAYNCICIPVAAGALSFAGLRLSPMLGAIAMSLSSLFVVSNALRLNRFDIHSAKKDKFIRKKERKTMEKTVKIEGMMCPHCEARVKKLLEELPGVVSADVSHKEGLARLTLSGKLEDAKIKEVITDNGYQVVEIR
ncbi:MAG: heavy metal translocating P-type ATPase [Clostridia bacterium]|nr:heavy metal translocating P-type ATPase [Clostridia bacterium]